MRALAAGEIGLWPVAELGLRYRRYRLADEAGERDMVQSLRRHGQITPLVVCRREEMLEVLDGFKRASAALVVGLVNLRCQVLAADERQAKVALLTLHGAGKRLVELEEAWLVQALVRDDGCRRWRWRSCWVVTRAGYAGVWRCWKSWWRKCVRICVWVWCRRGRRGSWCRCPRASKVRCCERYGRTD